MPDQRRRYTKATQSAAVGIAMAEGQRAAAEKLGIPLTTVHQWFHRPEYEQLRTTAREAVAEQMWIGVQIGIAEMVKGLQDPKVPLRDKTDAASMLAEKQLLLTGQATARTERIQALTPQMDDHERKALRDVIDKILHPELGEPEA